jgi:hypothetical protein
VTHDALVARLGLEIGISFQEVSDFRLDVSEQGTRPVAQNLSEVMSFATVTRCYPDLWRNHATVASIKL